MNCITLESDDPFFNLAIEEILLKKSNEDYLILGINKPCLMVGKHQSAHREVNTKFVTENNIPVIRRISGGGTVFHDYGNLNFTFIRQSEEGKQIDFRKYTLPVINFLLSLGLVANLEGRNNIKVGGLKISGNAEHIHRNRVLHHGTILFSVSLGMLGNSIRKDKSHYMTRAVDSNPASVMNLQEKLQGFRDISEFRKAMMEYFFHNLTGAKVYAPSARETAEAESLAVTKYNTWEWNWAYGPEYTFSNRFHLTGDDFTCNLSVKDGIIQKCTIEENSHMLSVSEKLIGCRHMVDNMLKVIENEPFFKTKEDIYNFF
jgi:lipoate---protein ligase